MRQEQTCEAFAILAQKQSNLAVRAPASFFAGAMLAGAYVGVGMILALSVGAQLGPETRPLAMGSVFGISMLLAVFGGGELFTGQAMFATFALLHRKLTPMRVLQLLALAWAGNLCGSVLVCSLFAIGGGGHVYGSTLLLHDLVAVKSQSSGLSLLARAILCNWLACLGLWTAARLKSDCAKMVILAWCVMAYVACGLDHGIANMALFTLGLLAPVPFGDLQGAAWSVALVSLGNLIGGGLLVAGAYSLYARGEDPSAEAGPSRIESEDLGLPHLAPSIQRELVKIGRSRAARPAERAARVSA